MRETASGHHAEPTASPSTAIFMDGNSLRSLARAPGPSWAHVDVAPFAESFLHWLRAQPGVRQALFSGDIRRRCAVVERIDVVLVTPRPAEAARIVARHPTVGGLEERSRGLVAKLELPENVQIVLNVLLTSPADAAATLLRSTGSSAYVDALDRFARQQRISLEAACESVDPIEGEWQLHASLGLPWIPPELREDRGEIEAGREGRLPALVEVADLRGDLGCKAKTEQDARRLAIAGRQAGLDWLALQIQPGSGRQQLHQVAGIRALDAELGGIRLLAAVAAPARDDGRLAVPATVLPQVEVRLCRASTQRGISRRRRTRQLVATMARNPGLIMELSGGELAAGCPLDTERVFRAALEHRCAVHVGAKPLHPALPDLHLRMAREMGVPMAFASGADQPVRLSGLRFAADQGRRAWASQDDVLNTLPFARVRQRLQPE